MVYVCIYILFLALSSPLAYYEFHDYPIEVLDQEFFYLRYEFITVSSLGIISRVCRIVKAFNTVENVSFFICSLSGSYELVMEDCYVWIQCSQNTDWRIYYRSSWIFRTRDALGRIDRCTVSRRVSLFDANANISRIFDLIWL